MGTTDARRGGQGSPVPSELIDGEFVPVPPTPRPAALPPDEIGGVSVAQAIQIAANYGLPPPPSSAPADGTTRSSQASTAPAAYHPRQPRRAVTRQTPRLSGWRARDERPAVFRPVSRAHPTAALSDLASRHGGKTAIPATYGLRLRRDGTPIEAGDPGVRVPFGRRGASVYGTILGRAHSNNFQGGSGYVVLLSRPLNVFRYYGGRAPRRAGVFVAARDFTAGGGACRSGKAARSRKQRESTGSCDHPCRNCRCSRGSQAGAAAPGVPAQCPAVANIPISRRSDTHESGGLVESPIRTRLDRT